MRGCWIEDQKFKYIFFLNKSFHFYLMKHFKSIEEIDDVPEHPKKEQVIIGGFKKCDFSDHIFVAYEEDTGTPILSHFYCSECKRWLSFCCSIGNIHSHLRCKHNEQINRLSPDEIVHLLSCFILTNGLPFRLIEDKYLSVFLPNPISRQYMAEICDKTAETILQKIAIQAESFKNVVGVFDEWTDNSSRSYLGITIHAVSLSPDNNYDHCVIVIGHIPLNQIHITNEYLAPIIEKKFHDLNLEVPHYFVTDAGPVCEPTIKKLKAVRKECWGHLLNLVLKDIHQELVFRLPLVFHVQLHYGKSTVFQSYMKSANAKRTTIPNYVETRFYSLHKLFATVSDLFDLINKFGEDELNEELLPESYRVFIDITSSFLSSIKSVLDKFESDQFGCISYILPGLQLIKISAEQFHDAYPELYAAFDGSYMRHIDPILKNPDKYNELLIASLLNPSINHKAFFSETEIKFGFEMISEEIIQKPDTSDDNSSQPISWENFSPPRVKNPLEKYKLIIENWEAPTIDLKDFWLIRTNECLKPLVPIAIKYLLPPATNTSSERLFSKARHVISTNRYSIGHERASSAVICAANSELADAAITDLLHS